MNERLGTLQGVSVLGWLAACSPANGTAAGAGGSTDTAGASDIVAGSMTGGASDTTGRAGAGDMPARCSAEEPADESSLQALADWTNLPTLRSGRYVLVTSTDREAMVYPPMPPGNRDFNNYVCRGVEKLPAGSIDVGTLFVDSDDCPEKYVEGVVAARFEGSGRLARLWATGVDAAGQAIRDGILRIYVDDQPEPCVEVSLGDAKEPPASLEIFAAPFGANTYNNLAWYYPVVFSRKLIVSFDNIPNDLVWYQAGVVLDETPTLHERATARLPARDDAMALLNSGATPVPEAAPLVPEALLYLPTDTPVALATLTGPATIHSFRVRVPDLAVSWDDATTPAIALPLAGLFASELGLADTETSSLPLLISKNGGDTLLNLRLPMPFATRAVMTLTNRAAPVSLGFAIDGLPSLAAKPWGHLTTIRTETRGPTTDGYHQIASANSEGRLVGTCIMAQGHSSALLPAFIQGPLNFLEGDERTQIDGQTYRGTGTEDYFDSAFYFATPVAAQFPFAQWGGKIEDTSNDKGAISACRWHILGAAIDFHQSLDLSLEIGLPDPSTLDRYVTTSYLYVAAGSGSQ
jgi:hypothetical protein